MEVDANAQLRKPSRRVVLLSHSFPVPIVATQEQFGEAPLQTAGVTRFAELVSPWKLSAQFDFSEKRDENGKLTDLLLLSFDDI